MIGLADLKTRIVWPLVAALVVTLAGLGASRVQVAGLRAELSDVKAVHARAEAARAVAAADQAEDAADRQAEHATTQQEIVHDLTKPDPQLAAARADNRALAGRLRDTSAQLAAVLAAAPAQADPAACSDQGDQHRAVVGLLAEAGRLSAEAVDLAAEARDVVAGRDREVAALMRLVVADRRLFGDASAVRFGQPTTGFPELVAPVE